VLRDLVLQCPANDRRLRGIVALRSPVRPNPIGSATATLVGIDGATLLVRGLDCIDGTPLLDLKPDRTLFTPVAPPDDPSPERSAVSGDPVEVPASPVSVLRAGTYFAAPPSNGGCAGTTAGAPTPEAADERERTHAGLRRIAGSARMPPAGAGGGGSGVPDDHSLGRR
jgi:hypothetical protein